MTDVPEFLTIEDLTSIATEHVNNEVEGNETHTEYVMEKQHWTWTWTKASTLTLLELYDANRKKVGTSEITNFKKLWTVIANLMTSKFNVTVTPAHCENRWRVLVRNHRKCINKTGRRRVYFEFENEMNKILGHKNIVEPQILLSTGTLYILPKGVKKEDTSNEKDLGQPNTSGSNIPAITNYSNTVRNGSTSLKAKGICETRRLSKSQCSRNDTWKKLRNDKLNYHNERLAIERERLIIEKDKLFERKRKNDLIEERNKIIKQCMAQKISLPNGI